MLNRKPHVENHRKTAESRLASRIEMLKAKGVENARIQQDPKVKQLKAELRKARALLADIEQLESDIAQRAEAKVRKSAEPKTDQKPQKAASSAAPKKVKKEKK